MGRAKRSQTSEQKKTEKVAMRIDPELRKRLDAFSNSGVCEGEELQVIMRMLIRAGLELEERMKVLRADMIQQLAEGGEKRRDAATPSSPPARERSR